MKYLKPLIQKELPEELFCIKQKSSPGKSEELFQCC